MASKGSPTWEDSASLPEDSVRATLTLSRIEIDRLKEWVTEKLHSDTDTTPKLHLSSYVVIRAVLWDCIIKTLNVIKSESQINWELCHFAAVADSRNSYDSGIPATFFGNCIHAKFVPIARSKFSREDSIANKPSKWDEVFSKGKTVLTLAGSPKLAVYDIDFGWGRPSKFVAVHIDINITVCVSLFDSGNESDGIEFGLCRSRHEMEVFTSVFQARLKRFQIVL